jgi:vitamin B12 transporter
MLDGSYLSSANRNRLGDEPLNRTFGERFTLGAQLSKEFAIGSGRHRLTAAAEHEGEAFRARDQAFFGGTNQDRSRDLTALVGEWRADWSERFTTDIAVRHDSFSAFRDATTVRASALVRPIENVTVHAAYGEGIAQPTFFDLFGFFPGSFVGNPALKPERSRGYEAGVSLGERAGQLRGDRLQQPAARRDPRHLRPRDLHRQHRECERAQPPARARTGGGLPLRAGAARAQLHLSR